MNTDELLKTDDDMTETHKIFDGEYYHNQTEFVEIEKTEFDLYTHRKRPPTKGVHALGLRLCYFMNCTTYHQRDGRMIGIRYNNGKCYGERFWWKKE